MKFSERLKFVVEQVAKELYDSQDLGVYNGAFRLGVSSMRDQLVETLDLSEYEAGLELHAAAEGFCYGTCYFGQEAEPGKHKACRLCPLKPFTVDAMQKNVADAMEVEP